MGALFDKLVKRQPVFRIDVRVMIQRVQKDQTVSQQESLILFLKVLWILSHIGRTELLDNPLDLVTLARQSELR